MYSDCIGQRSVLCLFVCPFYVCSSVCLSVCLSVCSSVCLSVFLSVCQSVCSSVCLFVCLFVSMFVCLSVCQSVCLSVCLFVTMLFLFMSLVGGSEKFQDKQTFFYNEVKKLRSYHTRSETNLTISRNNLLDSVRLSQHQSKTYIPIYTTL